MKTVAFKDGDYSHKFTKDMTISVETRHRPLFIYRHLSSRFCCPPHYSFLSLSSPSPHLKWTRHHFCFDYWSRERKTNWTKAPCGDNEIKTARPFSPLPSLLSFSFHFLTDTYWSGDHDSQLPAFKVTLHRQRGTRLGACPSEGWMRNNEKERADEGRKEGVKWQACEELFLPSVQV